MRLQRTIRFLFINVAIFWATPALLTVGCMFDPQGAAMTNASCGNGVVENDEACDDANTDGGDGCSASCEVEAGWVCDGEPSTCTLLCGNGVVDPGEECDGLDLDGKMCVDFGFHNGILSCLADCTFNTSECLGGDCGNGVLDAGEECDATNLDGQTCLDFGFSGGDLACSASCEFDTTNCTMTPTCGNGQVETGEECDDGRNGDSCDGCLDDCTEHVNSCGDGYVCSSEECDDGQNGDPCDGCLDDCTEHVNSCGDGYVCGSEECEGASSQICTTGCGSTGSQSCSESCVWTACQPPDEICNGVDDDCDTAVDEGCPVSVVFLGGIEQSPLYGNGEGGGAFEDTCPNGQVLVGLSGDYAGNVDRVRGHCGIVILVTDTSTTPYTYSIEINAGTVMSVHGSFDTFDYSLQCPAHTMAVGLSGQASGSAVTALELHCAPLLVNGAIGSYSLVRGSVSSFSVTGNNPGAAFAWMAPQDRVVNMLFGRSGAWIDALGVGAITAQLMLSAVPD